MIRVPTRLIYRAGPQGLTRKITTGCVSYREFRIRFGQTLSGRSPTGFASNATTAGRLELGFLVF
jgi:hypothetical protein